MATKILTVGPVLGAYSSLVTKVKAIDAKHGKFDMVICIGDFFANSESEDTQLNALLDDKLEVPITTYIMQGERPIPADVLKRASENSGRICSNLFLLEKTGVITTSQKLTIASFGGKYHPESFTSETQALDSAESAFTSHNLRAFLSSALLPATHPSPSNPREPLLASLQSSAPSQIDILLTNEWPAAITHHSKAVPPDVLESSLVQPLDDVVKASKPRYHFASSGGDTPIFWEREPYVWDGDLVSRFISLGSFGAPIEAAGKKQRWFYAFSITPSSASSPSAPRPANATASPFGDRNTAGGIKRTTDDSESTNYIFGNVQIKKPRLGDHKVQDGQARGRNGEKPPEGYACRICKSTEHFIRDCPEKNATGDTGGKKPPTGYVCRACGSDGHLIQDCPAVRERERQPRNVPKDISPDECWFCLSNPQLTKHLIVSIGTEVYLTLPKGQLPPTDDDSANPTHVPGGGHCLIIPVSHYPTFNSIPSSLASSVLSELDTYKAALSKLYSRHEAVPVCFEVSRHTGRGAGGHAHVQVVPVPENKKDGLEEAFRAYGGMQMSWEKDPLGALSDAAEKGLNYFRVDLPDGRKMVHVLRQGRPFNLQFGREALAHFLGFGDRADWKACSQTQDEEMRDAQAFKEAFAELDPSML